MDQSTPFIFEALDTCVTWASPYVLIAIYKASIGISRWLRDAICPWFKDHISDSGAIVPEQLDRADLSNRGSGRRWTLYRDQGLWGGLRTDFRTPDAAVGP